MKKALFILVFVLALAITPLIVWDNPAFADFYGDMRRAFGISQGYNASSAVVPNFANGYQIAGSDITSSAADLNKLDTITATGGVAVTERLTLTETAASGTYTATCVLPANSVVTDVVAHSHVNWGADTSAALTAGYTGTPAAFANAEDVKAGAPTLAGFTEAVFFSGGTTLTFTVVAVDATSTGGAGRDSFVVQYAVVTPIAATKS